MIIRLVRQSAAIHQLGPTSDADTISPPITVLLPGFMNGRRYWNTLLDVMEKSTLFVGHTIVSISLRGMGDSQYLNLTTHNDYLSNINDIFTILSRLGFESKKCIFIGQSFGSMIANQIVVHKPHRVYGIVLLGTLAYLDESVEQIVDSFKSYDGNNWSVALQNEVNKNWDTPYNDGRITKEFYDLMRSQQSKFKFEIMTQTEFRPYDLRQSIQKGYFDAVPIVLVRGTMDFIPRALIEPFISIGNHVQLLEYNCDSCDHDIVFGHEQDICEYLYQMIHEEALKSDL